MELKSLLKEYTASEFQSLVRRIWAVDLPKRDHDRLINHFDRIVGHPKGADLLFYSDDEYISNSPELIVRHVRDWHHKHGVEAFKAESVAVPSSAAPMSPVARSLAEVQKLAADVAVSEQAVGLAFGAFEQGIAHSLGLQSTQMSIAEQESSIRALELVRLETLKAVRAFDFLKMRVESAKINAQNNLTFARSEHAQWQSIAQQINATHDRYIPRLGAINQRHNSLHDQAETLLVLAQKQLIHARSLAKVGPVHAAYAITGSLTFADKRPDLMLENEPAALHLLQRVDLQKAIRSAVAEFTWQNTSGEPSDESQGAAVLNFAFTSRADAQAFAVSVPLIEFLPLEGQNWQSLAANRSEICIPFRMGATTVPAKTEAMYKWRREGKDLVQVHVGAFRRNSPTSRVRVRAAKYDEQLNMLSFTADGLAPATVCWSVPATQESRVPEAQRPSNRVGLAYSSPIPALALIAGEGANARADDYIVVFPANSGLDPLYVMFRNRREPPI
jgi:hypothetical protein